jgi:TPR repeat protein
MFKSINNVVLGLLLLSSISNATVQQMNDAYAKGDFDTTVEYMKPLIAQGNAEAMALAGTMFLKGEGADQNLEQGLYWLDQASQYGHIDSTLFLAAAFTKHGSEDWARACPYYKRAAEMKDKDGMFGTGICYLTGEAKPEFPEDSVEALAWIILAKDAGSPEAAEFMKDMTDNMSAGDVQKAKVRAQQLSGVKVAQTQTKKTSALDVLKKKKPKNENALASINKPKNSVSSNNATKSKSVSAQQLIDKGDHYDFFGIEFPKRDTWPYLNLLGKSVDEVKKLVGYDKDLTIDVQGKKRKPWYFKKFGNNKEYLSKKEYDGSSKYGKTVFNVRFKNGISRSVFGTYKGKFINIKTVDKEGWVDSVRYAYNEDTGDGSSFIYFKDGKPRCHYGYEALGRRSGQNHGRSVCAGQDGIKLYETLYNHGKKLEYRSWSTDGKFKEHKKWFYIDGKLVKDDEYYKNGNIKKKRYKRDKEWITELYYENGNIQNKIYKKDGKTVREKYDKNGKKI